MDKMDAAVQNGQFRSRHISLNERAKQNIYDKMTQLYTAAILGNLAIVKLFISHGADVNKENDKGRTLLHGAASRGQMKVLEYLIQQGCDVNKADANGWTPFNAAVQEGDLEAVKYLMTQGAKQNRYAGMPPLYVAALFGNLDIVKYLIFIGADVNEEDDDGEIPLHGAVIGSNVEIMKYLIQQGSDVNKNSTIGCTPFNDVVRFGHLNAVKYLMIKEAKQNIYEGMTPLYAAAQFGRLDIVKFFIFNGADVNEEDDEGEIPLHGAAIGGNVEIMRYLIQQGSDVNKGDVKGCTPCDAAVQNDHIEAVKYLMTQGAKQNRYDGMTPLYAAAKVGRLDIVDFFISKGADVNEEDGEGMIPLHDAAAQGHMEEHKDGGSSVPSNTHEFNPDIDQMHEEGYTPLYKAALEGHLEGVDSLISLGANPNKPSKGGLRPLHAAAQEGHAHIVDFLILQGADVNVECDLGQTPLHTTAVNGCVNIAEQFISEGSNVNKVDAKGWTPYNAVVQYGHLQTVKYHLTEGAKQNRYAGMNPLYEAAKCGNLDMVKFFISDGENVNAETDNGMIPLHGAAAEGHLKVMEYLIQQGSDVNKRDTKGSTPFNAAVQCGHLEAVKYLMTQGAKQNRFYGVTPLYVAAQFGHLDIVDFFISKGADVIEEDDEKKMIPLYGAAAKGHMGEHTYGGSSEPFNTPTSLRPDVLHVTNTSADDKCAQLDEYSSPLQPAEILEILETDTSDTWDAMCNILRDKISPSDASAFKLELPFYYGIDQMDKEGYSPLYKAVLEGNLEGVQDLISRGANPNKPSKGGLRPLHAAAQEGHAHIVDLLILQGAYVNVECDLGRTPLHTAAYSGYTGIVESLIAEGANLNKEDNTGWTPFNAAVQEGHIEAVKYLITKGAKENRYADMTLLYVAAQLGHLDIVKVIISNGADVNEEDNKGMIPLHGAATRGHLRVMEYLIQQGSGVNKENNTGWTPFNAAVQYGHLEAVKYLMTEGAKQNRHDGMTPLYDAARKGHLDIVKVLVSKGADVNEEDDGGMIPLHGAAGGGHMTVMEYLIQQGSDVNKKGNTRRTPLHAAVQEGHRDVVNYISFHVADTTARDIDGSTLLLAAVIAGHTTVIECIPLPSDGLGEGETRDPRTGSHKNLISSGVVTVTIRNGDTRSRTGELASQVDNEEKGIDCTQSDITKRGAGGLSLQKLSTRTHDDDKDAAHPNENEHLYQRRVDPNKEDTGDPLSEGHHNDAKLLAARGCARQKKKVVEMKETDTQSCSRQLTSQVDNADDTNDCTESDITKIGADELSLKNLSTGIHGDKKSGNEEHNVFTHAKPKYPDEQDPMLDQMEAIKSPGTKKRHAIPNGTDCSSQHGPQTSQYSGFDPPFLQTIETDGHPSEEPESRCHSIIDENRDMRESPYLMNAGNDLPINETSVNFESFPTHPPAVDVKPVSAQGTSSNPVWNIETKRRTSVYRCPSILALIRTFLQMIIALAILLAGSPVLVAGRDINERVTLQAGRPGVVPFHLPWPPNNSSLRSYFTIRFESNPRPFCINGEANTEGFKSSSQLSRFTTSVTDLDTSPCVNIMIDNVDTLDEDGYILTAVWHSFINVRYETVKKEIVVQIPPGSAKCFITVSENNDYPYEVHCRATTGSVTTTLSCYQNDQKIDVTGNVTNHGQVTRRIFWLPHITHFSCCSHDVSLNVSQTMCSDFEWPHDKETTRQTVNTVPTSVTTPIPQIESHTGSGACRQFMFPSMWHFTYLFVNLLAFATI